jgi:hypothetical protein
VVCTNVFSMLGDALSVGIISWAYILSASYMARCLCIVLLLCSAFFLFVLFVVLCACCEGNLFGCSANSVTIFLKGTSYLDSNSFAMCTLGYLATHDVDADAASMASSV